MKNPFIKENDSGFWIAAAVSGAIAAGTIAWIYFTRTIAEPEPDENATDYLKPRSGKHRKTTDLHDLHTIAAV